MSPQVIKGIINEHILTRGIKLGRDKCQTAWETCHVMILSPMQSDIHPSLALSHESMCVGLDMLFVLVMFLKCATCSVVCEIWGCYNVPWCRRGVAVE